MHRDGPHRFGPSFSRWWIVALCLGVASPLIAQSPGEPGDGVPIKHPVLGPQAFLPNITSTEGTVASTDDPNPLSPWLGVDTSAVLPNTFDPIEAAAAVFDQPADLADTQDFEPPELPFTETLLDTNAGAILRTPKGAVFNAEAMLFEANGVSPVGLTPESDLPYGNFIWPVLYTPRAIPIFKRVDKLKQYGPFRVGINVEVTEAYNDNVFGATTDRQGDQIRTISPSIYVEAGTKARLKLLYQPSWVDFAKYKEQSTTNQAFFMDWTYPLSKLKLGGGIAYVAQQGLYINAPSQAGGASNFTKQKTLSGQIFATYPLGRKTELALGAQSTYQSSEPGGSQVDNSISAAVAYRYSSQTTVGAALKLGTTDAPAEYQTYQQGQLSWSWHPTTALRFSAEGGIQLRQMSLNSSSQEQLVIPVYNAQINYNPSSTTLFNLTFYRNTLNTTFQNVSLNITTGVTTSLLLRLWGRVNLQMAMGYGYTEQIGDEKTMDGHYSFVQGGVIASYEIAKFLEVQVFDNLQQRFGDSIGNEYWSNTIGVSLSLKY